MPPSNTSDVQGVIFEVQRFCTHDGPGIRTTVFLKGCPLRCVWCHNPESWPIQPVLSYLAAKCAGCGFCGRVCPRYAHQFDEDRHTFIRALCIKCGACTAECYPGALELVGRDVSVDEIMQEILRDKPYYESMGGLTLSGGEPMRQIDFTEALLRMAKAGSLHCCVDTCGHAEYARFDRIRKLVDLFLFDYKETDPELHERFTGVDNTLILENLERLYDTGANILLRCPIIPGYNDRPDHFEGIAALARRLPRLAGVELMPYHPLGDSKIERFGLDTAARAQARPPSHDEVQSWIVFLKNNGVPVINEG